MNQTASSSPTPPSTPIREEVRIPAGRVSLEGELRVPAGAPGLVLFAHGSGSSRHSPRNQLVAEVIREAGIGTLLFDLLTPEEEQKDDATRELRFDIGLLAGRLAAASEWMAQQPAGRGLRMGLFGASTGGGAALVAAAQPGLRIDAVVSRGGRPDLAGEALERVRCPTLLLVGGLDAAVIQLNERAYAQLHCRKELKIIPRATHLFAEPGRLEEVARLSAAWFHRHLSQEAT
jgi:dienelactone hydrolase